MNGPNLNLLGRRQPEIYGTVSFERYFETLQIRFPSIVFTYLQTNHEGVLIDYLHQHGFEEETGIIINAGGLSHHSVSLRDAITSIIVPVVEVHISDIRIREPFRQQSMLTEVCYKHFFGFGLDGYRMAVDSLLAYPAE